MKKKLFNAVSTLAIAAIVALNVHVVTSEQTPAFLKWDAIGKILAIGTSGSGSGSGSGGKTDAMAYCSSCNGKLCTACTTKYNNGCTVKENCTISS
ncbi:MAG TPA: hypothetical protein VKY37_13625 [Brumimicrobium sp.]|nr:hypothetical protein [Brumimicrobium sp.]